MILTASDIEAIKTAVVLISTGSAARIDLGNDTSIYKVSSGNPNKYTIRMDIKVNESEGK